MKRIVCINGEFLEDAVARISIFDRGFLFGDGVYEVIPVLCNKLVHIDHVFERLGNSLAAVGIDWPHDRGELLSMLQALRERNAMEEGTLYLQITRGVAERDFAFPSGVRPTFVAFASPRRLLDNPLAETGISVVTVEDLRWKRRDIKSISLLAQCIARQQAVEAGAGEAWMVERNLVTEGSSSSAFIISDGCLITRGLSRDILPGIRRRVIVDLARQHDIPVVERAFSVEEAYAADEAFLSSAGNLVVPVVRIDGHAVAKGTPGALTRRIRQLYIDMLLAETA